MVLTTDQELVWIGTRTFRCRPATCVWVHKMTFLVGMIMLRMLGLCMLPAITSALGRSSGRGGTILLGMCVIGGGRMWGVAHPFGYVCWGGGGRKCAGERWVDECALIQRPTSNIHGVQPTPTPTPIPRFAWDRNLTDADGPYVELMAGVYTDNQPDFSFLHPYETRTFTQCW